MPDDAAPDAHLRLVDLAALLADLEELRLVLVADLGVAACAVELGEAEVALDVLDGGRQELGAFTALVGRRLTPGVAAGDPDEHPGAALPPRVR